jgi:hypothetical protein
LKDHDGKVIEQALNLLDPGNLTKVLRNIPTKDLIQIRDKIGHRFLIIHFPELMNLLVRR